MNIFNLKIPRNETIIVDITSKIKLKKDF